MTDRILRRPEVERLTGLSRSTLYDYVAQGHFPRPVKLGPRAAGWKESAVNQWIEERTEAAGA